MRHTAITRLVKAKTDIPTIQKISGDKTAATVMHYVHIHGIHIDHAISALDIGMHAVPVTPELHAHQVAATSCGSASVSVLCVRSATYLMVDRAGFEPAYGKPGQIYSLLPLTTRPPVPR